MPQYGNEEEKTLTYDKIKIRLASPEKIREWSRDEIAAMSKLYHILVR